MTRIDPRLEEANYQNDPRVRALHMTPQYALLSERHQLVLLHIDGEEGAENGECPLCSAAYTDDGDGGPTCNCATKFAFPDQFRNEDGEPRIGHIIEGSDLFLAVPFTWEVCGTCDGRGRHVNPSIDASGLTQEDFDEDPGFAEDYVGGMYDQTCNECKGRRVVPSISFTDKKDDPAFLFTEYFRNKAEEDAYYAAEAAAERRWGY